MNRRTQRALLGNISKNHRSIVSLFFVMAFIATLAACGGGSNSSSGGGSVVGATGNLVFTGSNSTTAFLRLIDVAYASNTPSSYTLVLNPINTSYIYIDDLGNESYGAYTKSGNTIAISKGTIALSACKAASATWTSTACIGTISGTLTISSSNTLSGTITIANGGGTTVSNTTISLTASTAWNQSGFNIATMENQTFTTLSTAACSGLTLGSTSWDIFGSTVLTSGGATVYLPCVKLPEKDNGTIISEVGTITLYTCKTLGTDCSTSDSRNTFNQSNTVLKDGEITIPSDALGFFGILFFGGTPTALTVGYFQQSSPGSTVFYTDIATELPKSVFPNWGNMGCTGSELIEVNVGSMFGANIGGTATIAGVQFSPYINNLPGYKCLGGGTLGSGNPNFVMTTAPFNEMASSTGFSF